MGLAVTGAVRNIFLDLAAAFATLKSYRSKANPLKNGDAKPPV
jgi:hypothetical protein